jgi:GT2 family glycosyltransferase
LLPTTTQAARLEECLDALARRLPAALPVEIVVVASASTPEVKRVLAAAEDSRLRVVECAVNLGVAGGYNRARAAARGELLCLLHDDTVIGEGWLEAMLDAADRYPDTGVFASVVTDPDGTLQSAGSMLWADAIPGRAWPAETAMESIREAAPVDFGPSCALAVRAELFDAIGGLDERFHPGYYVDVDCAFACREAGRLVRLVPAARAVHHRRSSSSAAYRDFLAERNRQRFVEKWWHRLAGRPPLDDSAAGLAAGRARVGEEAAALVASGAAVRPLVPRFHLDPGEQEERLRREESETLLSYRRYLEDQLAATTAALRWLEGQTLELARLAGVEVEHDAAGWPRFDRVVEALAAQLRSRGSLLE